MARDNGDAARTIQAEAKVGRSRVSVVVRDGDHPSLVVEFGYDYLRDGFLVLRSLQLTQGKEEAGNGVPTEITIQDLRGDFPWAKWADAARKEAVNALLGERPVDESELAAIGIYIPPGPLGTVPRDSPLRRLGPVALEYRRYLRLGLRDPAAQIARTHGVKPATARSWIHRARKAGLLGPAKGPTAGEYDTYSHWRWVEPSE